MAPFSAASSLAAMPLALALALAAATGAVASAGDPGRVAGSAAAARFLRAQPPSELGADLQQALSEALGVGFRIHGGRVLAAQVGLEPMWRTMAKDSQGRVDRRSLRYMVQRYFRQRYHISIVGMETLQVKSSSSAAEAKLLAELTPNFVRSLLEGTSAEAGFSLEDTAALIAVMERLIEDAGHEQLEASYKARGLDITDLLTRYQLLDVMKHYMVRWLYGENLKGIAKKEANRTRLEETMNNEWKDFMLLAKGHVLAFEHQHSYAVASGRVHGSGLREAWNPLRPLFSFADAQVVISGISAEFGHFWETECESLTQVLSTMDRRGTGRVSLSSFHTKALEGQWHFTESAAYLRQLGVLEESSVFHGPQVLSSNYMQSANSCVVTQKHFRVCCASPCQDFYTDLEVAIGAPEGAPEVVLAIVSNFTYGLDDATPRITKKLKAQLQEIAQANHGKIPLHGRLFAQWLHFVFPSECPFPHKSNSVSGLSPKEFGSFLATKEELRESAARGKNGTLANGSGSVDVAMQQHGDSADSDEFLATISYDEEELLSQHLRQSPPSTPSWLRAALRPVLYGLATFSVFVVGVLQPAMQGVGVARECCGGLLGKLPGGQEKTADIGETKSHFV